LNTWWKTYGLVGSKIDEEWKEDG
jgi:hypothetical protein